MSTLLGRWNNLLEIVYFRQIFVLFSENIIVLAYWHAIAHFIYTCEIDLLSPILINFHSTNNKIHLLN